jgi:hypothetical protein
MTLQPDLIALQFSVASSCHTQSFVLALQYRVLAQLKISGGWLGVAHA